MTKNGIIRWGISATGEIASAFAADIVHTANARLAGVTSREPQRAAAFAARFPGATPFASLGELTASAEIDAIFIASPHSAHLEQARIALAAGKPILVEKPLTASLADAEALKAAAESARVFAMEGLWSRFLPAVRLARENIRAGEIGAICRVDAELAWPRPYDPGNRFFDPAKGGGALLDLGVYPISLTRFLLGEPDHVDGRWTEAPTGIDVRAELMLRFGPAVARLSCGFDRIGDNRLVIEGERGTLVLGMPMIGADRLSLYRSRRLAEQAFPGGETFAARARRKLSARLPWPGTRNWLLPFPGSGLQYEIEAASRAILDGLTNHPDCLLSDSLATLAIIERILSKPAVEAWRP